MSLEYGDFIHPSDKKALAALKAIPAFDLVLKKFMSVVGEKMFKIETTSSYLKLGENQMPEIYAILVKVCDKLRIEVPELYLALDREPNAYTYGDTDIFIVLNSGLLETLTPEQLETVIAHECGHIVCRHVLYSTMAQFFLTGADFFRNGILSAAVIASLQYAFAYWMRCSEFSADRVAAVYHGSAAPVVDVMMALSGGTHNLKYTTSKEAFFKQAEEYRELVKESKYNKLLEFIQFGQMTHPLNAYRAYAINEFYSKYSEKTGGEREETASEKKNEYALSIAYEFEKPKSVLKRAKCASEKRLEVCIGNETHYIEKNTEKTLRLKRGKYELSITNTVVKVEYKLNLRYNTKLIVRRDGESGELSVSEEL